MDQKPFIAQLDAMQAAYDRAKAANDTAVANLKRVKPLTEQNALSQKDLDDAKGQYEQAGAAVAQSKAQLDSAKLDLSYTVISSPVDGVTSYSAVAEGSYLNAQNSQLTTVSVLSPMWVNFSLSENEIQRVEGDIRKGRLKLPPNREMTVEIEQGDGTLFPYTGKITFADPSYNAQTGTFLIRATVDNPKGTLRPNQYVRARLKGATRPNAILVPQRAVQQGGRGHFVWIVGKDNRGRMGLGMAPGTSPSIAALPGGGWQVAFQAADRTLWVIGKDNRGSLGLGMAAKTSPAIAALNTGGWEVAFQANTGHLWMVGADTKGDMGLGLAPGTSPAITAMPGGGWEAGFRVLSRPGDPASAPGRWC